MKAKDIPIEFQSDLDHDDDTFYSEIENRVRDLADGHQDITGAAARLERAVQGRETTPLYEAGVVIYMRPNNIAATEKDEDADRAMQGALDAVERQVREKREQLRNY